jgi:hypothetical protein
MSKMPEIVSKEMEKKLTEIKKPDGGTSGSGPWAVVKCPNCGSTTDLARLTDDDEGKRYLCTKCRTKW